MHDLIMTEIYSLQQMVLKLVNAFEEYRPVIEAYRRGGMLAARTAAKRNGRT